MLMIWFLLWSPGSKAQGATHLRIILPESRRYDSHPSVMKLTELASTLPCYSEKFWYWRKASEKGEEANSGF